MPNLWAAICWSSYCFRSLILFFSFRTIRGHYIESLTGDLTHLCFPGNKNNPTGGGTALPELDAFIKDLGKHIETRLTVIDPSGVVVADSEKNPLDMEKHNLRAEIIPALQGEVTGQSVRFSSTVQQEMLYVAVPIQQQGRTIGVLRASLFMQDINALLEKTAAEHSLQRYCHQHPGPVHSVVLLVPTRPGRSGSLLLLRAGWQQGISLPGCF